MKYLFFPLVLLCLVCLGALPTHAEGQAPDEALCQAVVQAAIVNTSLECGAAEAGQVCYGNEVLSILSLPGEWRQQFTRPGAALPALHLQTLNSGGFNPTQGEWGMAFARLPLLDEEAQEPVTLLIFGAAQIENFGLNTRFYEGRITHRGGSFARSAPDAEAQVITPLVAGQRVNLTGRLSDSAWLRVELDNAGVGWVSAEVLALLDETLSFDDLPIIDPATSLAQVHRPLRAFNFRSGIGDAPCDAAPESGILIQTPENASLKWVVNNIPVDITGTVFLQARTEQHLMINVLQGRAEARIAGELYRIPAGERLQTEGEVSIAPYEYTRVEMLPIELLPRRIVIESAWMRRIIAPRENPLAGIGPGDRCRIAAPAPANIRTGPGVDYPYRATMMDNWSAHPDGRARGSDGQVWWRLEPGSWVNTQVMHSAGDCSIEAVPLITSLPRLSVRQ